MLLGLALFSAVWLTAMAAPLTGITYSAQLKAVDGTPVTTAVALGLALYTQPGGGSAVWQGNCSAVTPDSEGNFTVALSSCGSLPDSLDAGQLYYLGVAVGTNSEATPRIALGVTQAGPGITPTGALPDTLPDISELGDLGERLVSLEDRVENLTLEEGVTTVVTPEGASITTIVNPTIFTSGLTVDNGVTIDGGLNLSGDLETPDNIFVGSAIETIDNTGFGVNG